MTSFYLTRHGESEHNLREEVFMGRWPGANLTPKGLAQAGALGRRLAGLPIQAVVHSSLPRTTQTAAAIAAHLKGAVLYPEEAFWELSKGDWEGVMPKNNIPPAVKAQRDADPFGFRYPNGESYADVWARTGPALDGWLDRLEGQTVLFVLHGDVMRSLLYHMIRFPQNRIDDFATDPCALNEFSRLAPQKFLVVRLNDASHLG